MSSRCISQYREQMVAKWMLNKHKYKLGIVLGCRPQLQVLCYVLQNIIIIILLFIYLFSFLLCMHSTVIAMHNYP